MVSAKTSKYGNWLTNAQRGRYPSYICLLQIIYCLLNSFELTSTPLIWSPDFHRESGEAERDGRVYRVRYRDGEAVNEGGDRQRCRSFLRWNRLSLLSSPLLTWPWFLKKTMRAGEENTEERVGGEKGRDTLSPHLSSHHFGGWQTQI